MDLSMSLAQRNRLPLSLRRDDLTGMIFCNSAGCTFRQCGQGGKPSFRSAASLRILILYHFLPVPVLWQTSLLEVGTCSTDDCKSEACELLCSLKGPLCAVCSRPFFQGRIPLPCKPQSHGPILHESCGDTHSFASLAIILDCCL